MIVSSFNMRGLGGRLEKKKIKALIRDSRWTLWSSKKQNWNFLRIIYIVAFGGVMIIRGRSSLCREIVEVSCPCGVNQTLTFFSLLQEKVLLGCVWSGEC